MRTFLTPLLLLVLLASAGAAGADPITATRAPTIYDNTEDTGPATGFGGSINLNILIDDVLVPVDRNPLNRPLAVTEVTVGVTTSLTPTTLSLWSYPVQPDGSPGLGGVLIGTADIPAPTGDTTFISFQSGSQPMLTIRPVLGLEPGFGLFYIGLGSDQTTNWLWADGPDVNRATAYNHILDLNTIFINTSPGRPFPPHLSYHMQIQAAPTPEPTTLCLLGSGLLVSWSGRRWSKRG